MTRVYFVRHAQPEHDWEEDRTRPLTEEGKKDSAIVLEFLKDKKIDAFYCSPYKRSMDTIAEAAAFFGKEIITDERLREREKGPDGLRELRQNGSPEPEFEMDEDRTYLNTIIHIRDGFEKKEAMSELMSESMSESMSELERARMQVVLGYLNGNKEISSVIAAELLGVEVKTASRLLSKAEKLDILKGEGKTKNKVYSAL
mgnify:CR=1 FL=1